MTRDISLLCLDTFYTFVLRIAFWFAVILHVNGRQCQDKMVNFDLKKKKMVNFAIILSSWVTQKDHILSECPSLSLPAFLGGLAAVIPVHTQPVYFLCTFDLLDLILSFFCFPFLSLLFFCWLWFRWFLELQICSFHYVSQLLSSWPVGKRNCKYWRVLVTHIIINAFKGRNKKKFMHADIHHTCYINKQEHMGHKNFMFSFLQMYS